LDSSGPRASRLQAALRAWLTEFQREFPGTFAEHKRCCVALHCHLARICGPAEMRERLADFAEFGDGA
jgi:trehalose-6-phosphatase